MPSLVATTSALTRTTSMCTHYVRTNIFWNESGSLLLLYWFINTDPQYDNLSLKITLKLEIRNIFNFLDLEDDLN